MENPNAFALLIPLDHLGKWCRPACDCFPALSAEKRGKAGLRSVMAETESPAGWVRASGGGMEAAHKEVERLH
jgi:hypothetical protein